MANPIIQNPCPEKWEGMTPDEQGRFCGKCSKIVFDFTKKTTQEIVDFLTARKGDDICGKLRKPALVPVRVSKGIKLFAAAIYLAFGSLLFSSCGPTEHEEPIGKVGLDSAEAAENQYQYDSMMAADSMAVQPTNADTTDMDSAKMMSTINILDSIMKAKNK